jgi:hypothetical protein
MTAEVRLGSQGCLILFIWRKVTDNFSIIYVSNFFDDDWDSQDILGTQRSSASLTLPQLPFQFSRPTAARSQATTGGNVALRAQLAFFDASIASSAK